MKKAKLTFTGTGASTGVPMVGCSCKVCSSSDPRNQRFRSSALLEIEGKRFFIDVGPDFRLQALRAGVEKLDGIFLTHAHFDHIGGLDDLRPYHFRGKEPIPCCLSTHTWERLKERDAYLFDYSHLEDEDSRLLSLHFLEGAQGDFFFAGIKGKFVSFYQKKTAVTGFRWGEMSYILDIKTFSSDIFTHLKGTKYLVLSALREEESQAHLTIKEAIEFAKEVGAEKTWLSHLSHAVDHEKTSLKLPPFVQLAYDGLCVEFNVDG